MEQSFSHKWVVILFFGVVGIIFTISMIYLAAGNVAPDTYWGRKMTLPKSEGTGSLLSTDKYVLERNLGRTIGDRTFFFRGRQNDHILFGVIIPEIDRQYPYPFKISLPQAGNGFEVAGIWLEIITVRPNFVSVKVIK
ncbi:hypothetical protein DSCA_44700 [Desulfosarcina alkanivorans]|jgi:hypothetical protein|uniref:Uncharacterized protein n=1 Tax=Desulfosarcina alkanivorans TaxID=571177 RepID=A0A5K7YQ99_9BACT|nr:hypothetical protein [Desulfosarcina alkanivorans]BBO70540.1 hypothetical protein DSCA_44700 [Desulfosarcina alkanivorans]